MRSLRILTWHVHGSYLYYLSRIPHRIYVPFKPDRSYATVVITNQAAVAHGRYSEQAVQDLERRIRFLLAAHGLPLHGFYYCPHDPTGIVPAYTVPCRCRKPSPGLIIRAAADLRLSLADSWMVGDILDDVEAGRRAGCHTVLIDNGHETEWRLSPQRIPNFIADDLAAAARLITRNSQQVHASDSGASRR